MQTERDQTQSQQSWGWDVPCVHSHPAWAPGAEATTLPCLTLHPPREGGGLWPQVCREITRGDRGLPVSERKCKSDPRARKLGTKVGRDLAQGGELEPG